MRTLSMTTGIEIILGLILATSGLADNPHRMARTIPDGTSTRERFQKLLDRPRVALRGESSAPVPRNGLVESTFSFDSEPGIRVPGIMIAQASESKQPRPVVIVLHGTGGSKLSVVPLLRSIAAQHMIGVAIDGRFAGERSAGVPGAEAYKNAIFDTWKSGHGFPFLYDTVWDILRLMDYLETRGDVNSKRIGAIGISKGGMELYLAAAVDERLVASVPCVAVQSFAWALQNNAWQSRIGTIQSSVDRAAMDVGLDRIDAAFVRRFYDRVVPGIDSVFDGPSMLPLIAPRSLLVINGEIDHRTPGPGLQLCVTAARDAYQRAGAASEFEFILQKDTGHAVLPESERYAIEWLRKKLSQRH